VPRRSRPRPDQKDGLLVLDKPAGPTSAGCLDAIKRALRQPRIGHAGTLDPMARGVLLVLLGQGTKLAPYLAAGDKVYAGTIELGVSTDTFDSEGAVVARAPTEGLDPAAVERELLAWRDLTEQAVPAYSAAKHKGKPLYALARAGEEVPERSKKICVKDVEPLEIRLPYVRFRVRCSSGTYVRSLAHSLGTRLGCGAVLAGLTRERSEPFGLEEAHALDAVLAEPERFPERIIPLSGMLPHWPRHRVGEPVAALVRNGAWLPASETPGEELFGRVGDRALLLGPGDEPLALVEVRRKDNQARFAILRGLWPEGGRETARSRRMPPQGG